MGLHAPLTRNVATSLSIDKQYVTAEHQMLRITYIQYSLHTLLDKLMGHLSISMLVLCYASIMVNGKVQKL